MKGNFLAIATENIIAVMIKSNFNYQNFILVNLINIYIFTHRGYRFVPFARLCITWKQYVTVITIN